MRLVTASERRARLARRHRLAPGAAAAAPLELAERLVGLHASDPATPFLAARARLPGFAVDDLESALYEESTLRKHLGMRRTLFVLPTELVPTVQAACTDQILARERRRLAADVERGGIAKQGARWLARAERAALRELAARGEATGAQLSREVPELRARLTVGEGRSWGGEVGVAGRVLTILAAAGRIVRGRPDGSWTSSRHRWRLAPEGAAPVPPEQARLELVRRWLSAHGPVALADLAWWSGLGLTRVRAAAAALGVVEVDLGGEVGIVLPDDVEPEEPVEPWAAFLPSLDPTTMGWKRRDWYLGEHAGQLFDRSGNAGATVWWDGRAVGGWAQRADGELVYRLLEDVGSDARRTIAAEGAALRDWLGPTVVSARFPGLLEVALRAAVEPA